jgi:hypothetical protein
LEIILSSVNPKEKHPMQGFSQICFIQNTVSNPNIIIGDFTYYDDPVMEEIQLNVYGSGLMMKQSNY